MGSSSLPLHAPTPGQRPASPADAAGHEQVRPLLPGTSGGVVLVTSRRRLTALEDSAVISLGTLSPAEAVAQLAGRSDLGSGAGPAGDIARLCGYLRWRSGCSPGSCGIILPGPVRNSPPVSRRPVTGWPSCAENLSVAAAFDLSCADLSEFQQRLFRRLGLTPGADIDAYAVSALDDVSLESARGQLDELYDHHLVTEPAPGRYLLHDLLREYARALAAADGTADSHAAAGRW